MKFLFYAVAIYVGISVFLYFAQRSLIYFPSSAKYSPKEAGVAEMQVVSLLTKDDLKIQAWYRPPKKPQFPTLVYFHGNAGNIAGRAFLVRPFLDKGYGVLLLTYRGYSGNPGRPSEKGLYSDARASLEFLKSQGVPEHCMVLYGNSIGAAVAFQMATEYDVGAIVLQSPFTSLEEVAKIHYAFFYPFIGMIQDKYDSLSKVTQIQAPVLIMHGKEDTIIPPELSRKLFAALQHPKEAEYVPGRGHNDLFKPEYVIQFIRKHVKCDKAL